MASLQLQNDKGNAMRMFHRKLCLENIFHLFNVCAAILLVFSHSCFFPITLQTVSNLFHLLLPLFHNSFYAFILLNAIILFLFALSNNNSNNVCNEKLDVQTDQSCLIVTAPQEQPRTVDSFEETVTAVTETTTCCTTVTTTEGETVSEKCYRRVQSESYERRMVVAPPRVELKRCNSTRRVCSVEQLSEEEFNRAVEEFIAMHKRMQWEEQIGSHTTNPRASRDPFKEMFMRWWLKHQNNAAQAIEILCNQLALYYPNEVK